ncbi:MAG: LamG-like jellyroll fold domain-containing protein [Bacteroidota bacterium]
MKKHLLSIAVCFFILQTQAQNYALSFNGSSQYVNIPDQASIELSNNFTIEGWIYPTGPGSVVTQGGIIFNKENSYELARFTDGTLEYALSANGAGTDWNWVNSGLVTPLNTWSHFAFIKSGASITIYLNGSVSYTNGSNPVTLTANAQPLYIANRANGAQLFNGNIDEMRIWNTARTQVQIKANMLNRNLANNASGLVAYYRMNENSGTTTANSCTNTSGINGTLVGTPAWVASPVQYTNNSLSFDGIDDVVTIPYNSSLDISTAITLEAWVYATKNSGIQNVMSKSSSASNTGYIFPRTDNGWANVIAYLNIAGGWKTLSAPYPSLNAWHHLAVTYDGTTMKLYIDGVLSNSIAQTGSIAVNTNPLALGNQTGFSEYFGGYADEMRIWNVARTQAQIQANMSIELDPTIQTGLASYYTFNQGATTGTNTGLTTVIDQTGNNNGTLTNFTLSGTVSNFVAQFSNLSALPVSWLGFSAQKQGNNVLLNWSTASEQNNRRFIVQHSTDGSSWNTIENISATGNRSSVQTYSFVHTNPVSGANYYRILQEDLDGKISFSKVVSLSFVSSALQMSVYPNPVTDGILHIQLRQSATVLIYNSAGILVKGRQLPAGSQTFDMSGLPKGVYQVKAGDEVVKVVR